MDLEIYPLRIFIKVMKFKSFSEAARNLGITQPTVSQQIARLEADLGRKLFERVGHEIIPTSLGKQLLTYAQELTALADDCENFLIDHKSSLKGEVAYAMPESCQWTPHFKRIMSEIKTLPEVNFKIGILPSDQVAKAIIQGEYDFGFIVGEKLHPELRFEKFAEEEYVLVAKDSKQFQAIKDHRYSELRFVAFPGWELFFTTWSRAHDFYDEMKKTIHKPILSIGTLAGAIHAIEEGAGVAVLPRQCVNKKLEIFKTKKVVASNPIYITSRVGDKLPKRVETILEMLRNSKKHG